MAEKEYTKVAFRGCCDCGKELMVLCNESAEIALVRCPTCTEKFKNKEEKNSERIWEEECGGRCAILHLERCPRYEEGECKFPETRKAKEIVEKPKESDEKMEIKDQLCSLGPAKELKELGIKQDSLWYWVLLEGYFDYKLVQKGFDPKLSKVVNGFYSAFTDAELEREIFQWIGNQEVLYDFMIHFSPTGGVWGDETFSEMYEVQLIDWSGEEESLMERAGTGANAKAKMLIYLLKNNLIEK